jgi:hypothetical protein
MFSGRTGDAATLPKLYAARTRSGPRVAAHLCRAAPWRRQSRPQTAYCTDRHLPPAGSANRARVGRIYRPALAGQGAAAIRGTRGSAKGLPGTDHMHVARRKSTSEPTYSVRHCAIAVAVAVAVAIAVAIAIAIAIAERGLPRGRSRRRRTRSLRVLYECEPPCFAPTASATRCCVPVAVRALHVASRTSRWFRALAARRPGASRRAIWRA